MDSVIILLVKREIDSALFTWVLNKNSARTRIRGRAVNELHALICVD